MESFQVEVAAIPAYTPPEFDKKVEIEMEHLIYMDRMSKPEALAKAKQTISAKYQKE